MFYTSKQRKISRKLEKQANKLLWGTKVKVPTNYKKVGKRNNRFVKNLRKKATKEEVIVGKWLLTQGVYFIFQKGFFKPFHRIVDFYLPRRCILEIDGGYHKNTIQKDSDKDYLWAKHRFMSTVRITNEQVLDGSFKEILSKYIGNKRYDRDKTHKSIYPSSWDEN